MAVARTILIVVPDREFRRSLEFALEVEGFSVESLATLAEAEASTGAFEAVCAVVDDAALRTDSAAQGSLGRLAKPVILLADGFSSTAEDSGLTVLTKPLHGNALIELVQAISARALASL